MGLDVTQLHQLLELQHGLISRRQVTDCGGGPHDIRRLLRRRHLARVYPGVYVEHTGELTWIQRAQAAVLYAGTGSALDRESALRADAGPGWRGVKPDAPINVAVDINRTVRPAPGVAVRRVTNLKEKVRWSARPPRLRPEEATVDLALSKSSDHDKIEVLASAVRTRCTTAQRLIDALESRPRVARRKWLLAVLSDIRDGTASVLEHGYLVNVERAHGLPAGRRQAAAAVDLPDKRTVYRDVDYEDFDLLVELDGRLDHDDPAQRDADLDRDLEAAVELRRTVRLGWAQAFARPCRTAGRIGRLLNAGGWTGEPNACGPDCELGAASAA